MDAMLFFTVSMVICGVLTSYVIRQGVDQSEEACAFIDPDEMLAVYLDASLGRGFVLDGIGLELTGREQFAETLFLISAMVLQGHQTNEFVPVLTHCDLVLSGLCHPLNAVLRLMLADRDPWSIVIQVGQDAPEGSETTSASQNLGVCEGTPLMATLMLLPAFLPHSISI